MDSKFRIIRSSNFHLWTTSLQFADGPGKHLFLPEPIGSTLDAAAEDTGGIPAKITLATLEMNNLRNI